MSAGDVTVDAQDVDQLAQALRSSEQEVDHLRIAMSRRTVIGQAQGILMERLGIDADRAFDYLRRASSESNRKLYVVAEAVVGTRQLPGA